ncbi:fungal-specific transcription factor domain-containing protein [Xylogone sp. PMI_703]|nr:fungal-specific transcription factor domain-containing protein [Xylogone sp. PMI_703]
MAMQELQNVMGRAHTWHGIKGFVQTKQALTCCLHLLFFETSSGSSDWNIHSRTAATLVPQLLETYGFSSSETVIRMGGQKNEINELHLSFEDRDARSLLLSSFLWFDILATASTRSKPFLGINHLALLETNGVSVENIMGCENWVLAHIFRIGQLDRWKKESESNFALSISELVKRGSEIEGTIQKRLCDHANQKTIQSATLPCGAWRNIGEYVRPVITNIFALAALTYLHVVISGANPDIPEIRDSVSRTISALEAVTDPDLMRFLAWPLCVTGCLASEQQKSFFLSIISEKSKYKTARATLGAFRIIEECWRLRIINGNGCDWVMAMKSLDYFIILV